MSSPNTSRFYKNVSISNVEGGFQILLDWRPIRTGKKAPVLVPAQVLAEAISSEWEAQEERIDLQTMPLTRLAQRASDLDDPERERIIADIVSYAGSDLLCYRALDPDGLVVRQSQVWQPLLDWAEEELQLALNTTTGISRCDQPAASLDALAQYLSGLTSFELASLGPAVALLGSAVLGLALYEGRLAPDDAFAASQLDEIWQSEQWGADDEAEQRRDGLRKEINILGHYLECLG